MRGIAFLGILAAVAAADLGTDLARAQEKGDLLEVQRLLREVRKLGSAEQFHALMLQLDPKRAGAFVSAPCIARHLVLDATASGNTRFVADAAKVLRAHAHERNSGKCAQVMSHYADALEAVTNHDDGSAALLLGEVLARMRDEGWAPLAIHAACELAAVSIRRGDTATAAQAIGSLADLLPKGADISLTYILRSVFSRRLQGAPADVTQALEKVMGLHRGGHMVTSAGGRGGRGGRGESRGAPEETKLAAALRRFSSKKALVTVFRSRKGFELRQGFDKRFAASQPSKHGTYYHARGGVTLGFWDRAVGLYMLDPRDRRGQPGESTMGPGPTEAYYFLGREEKWQVTKTGVVTIR